MKIYEYENVEKTRRCGTKALAQPEHSVNVRAMTYLPKSFKASKEEGRGEKISTLSTGSTNRVSFKLLFSVDILTVNDCPFLLEEQKNGLLW
ncbi:hypothetical protein AVEN_159075-1 [Araneus ventricosus]|uniref:Uncharacterized protein n=1 Tax=Araneus ventricosus TaxID=182803 RepID=A0A4Y2BAX1_ARAVE|nr:hypothetical protein AVEN_159075-1 [Araneus ventricosus]